ncbi:Apoptosis regulatory protein Siva [Lonchura striata]|uniref:Apoptosis regulatory protein Siva n=1 Tax=Lonchura striata TaxID=40157 RepID=A0A218UQT6_9PASE|nr:Apoptosis regulatory protein Siva [Lonchura striata domestica]
MPKRSCPFGDAAPLQLKTRVGLRELSRGVRGEEYRREVFELIPSFPCLCRAVPPVGASRACSSCVRTADVKEACAQCDRFVCQSCSRLCSCCNTVTCSLCSAVE